MKEVRKALAFFLIVCMMAAFVPAAFAEDPKIEIVRVSGNDQKTFVEANGNQVDVNGVSKGTEGTITLTFQKPEINR